MRSKTKFAQYFSLKKKKKTMSWTKSQDQVFTTTTTERFFCGSRKRKPRIVHNSSKWTLHSLHTVLENSIVQSNPILWHSTNCWDFVSATPFNFAQIHVNFPVFLTIPTWFLNILSKLHFLLLLSLPFLFLYKEEKKRHNF